MKFICTLPELKHYQPVQSQTPGKYIWVDKGCSLVQVSAPMPNPWHQKLVILLTIIKAKNNTYQYPSKLNLRCFPLDETNSDVPAGKVEREIMRGKFAYSVGNPIGFYCFALEANEQTYTRSQNQQWLLYSFYVV